MRYLHAARLGESIKQDKTQPATLQSNTRYAPKEAPLDTYDLAKVYTQEQFGCILQRYEDNQKEDVA